MSRLFDAVISRNVVAAEAVLRKDGVDVDAVDDGWTCLTRAAGRGDVDMMRLLLRHGAAVDAPDGSRWTALMMATVHGSTDAARTLLDHGATVDARDKYLFISIAKLLGTAAKSNLRQPR